MNNLEIILGEFARNHIAVVNKEASTTSECHDPGKLNPRHLQVGKICFLATISHVW